MAQNAIFNNPDNKAYFGLRVSGVVTCPGNVSEHNVSVDAFKNGGGFEIGGIYNMPIVANFYIEPGIKFYKSSFSLKDEFVEDIEDDIRLNSVSIKKYGFRIPVMAGYHFDFTDNVKVSAFTGPELEIGLSAKEYVKGYNIETSGDLYGDDGGMKRVDLLWGIGAGVTYKQFYFGVNGNIGMLNMTDDRDIKFHENHVTFIVGFNF